MCCPRPASLISTTGGLLVLRFNNPFNEIIDHIIVTKHFSVKRQGIRWIPIMACFPLAIKDDRKYQHDAFSHAKSRFYPLLFETKIPTLHHHQYIKRMKKLEFKIDIAADRQKVWNTMLDPDTYKEWVKASWPGSYYEGNWKQGEDLRFLSPGYGGTLARLEKEEPYKRIVAKHIAVINTDGTEDRTSEVAKGWIGTTESYAFTGNNGGTELKIEINTYPGWEKMFTDGWPKALARLKEICES